MRTLKVFVLTRQGRDIQDQNTLEVVGVYSTKSAAKAKFKEKQEDYSPVLRFELSRRVRGVR